MAEVFTRAFWSRAAERAARSGAQGFLVGAGFGAGVGNYAVLTGKTLLAGAVGAASMAILSVVTSVAFPPDRED